VTAERDLLRSLVDHLSSMVAYWDSSLRCRFANRAYEKWFGVPPEKVIGMHLPDLLGPTMYESNRPYIEGVLRGEPQEFEGELADPEGGRPRHGLACFVPDIADDGEARIGAALRRDARRGADRDGARRQRRSLLSRQPRAL
jgi:PAS domain S-box-containing protein